MPPPRLKVGAVEFDVPFMDAGILEDLTAELQVYVGFGKKSAGAVLAAEEIRAVRELGAALARKAGLEKTTAESMRQVIDTSNLAAWVEAIGFAYIGKPRGDAAGGAEGEAKSP